MNNVQIYLIVEGQTERTFVRDVLAPVIATSGLLLYPVLIGKPGHKGGDLRFERAKSDIGQFLKQRSDTYISTMFDYYRISPIWPGRYQITQQLKIWISMQIPKRSMIIQQKHHRNILNN